MWLPMSLVILIAHYSQALQAIGTGGLPRDLVAKKDEGVDNLASGDRVGNQARGVSVSSVVSYRLVINSDISSTDLAASSAPPVATVSVSSGIPVSTNVSDASAIGGISFDVSNTSITLYLHYNLNKLIPKLSMGKAILEALVSLRKQRELSSHDLFPADDWTYIKQEWDCIISIERAKLLGPTGKPQQLTYSLLIDIVEALWEAMFSKGRFCAATFDVFDKHMGPIAYGSMVPWSKSSEPLNTASPVDVV